MPNKIEIEKDTDCLRLTTNTNSNNAVGINPHSTPVRKSAVSRGELSMDNQNADNKLTNGKAAIHPPHEGDTLDSQVTNAMTAAETRIFINGYIIRTPPSSNCVAEQNPSGSLLDDEGVRSEILSPVFQRAVPYVLAGLPLQNLSNTIQQYVHPVHFFF